MSKIETLRLLPTPADLRLSASQVSEALAQTVQQLQTVTQSVAHLEQLPSLTAEQVTDALAPLGILQAQLETVLGQFDQVNKSQRLVLSETTQEMARTSSEAVGQSVKALDTAAGQMLGHLSEQTKALDEPLKSLKEAMRSLSNVTSSIKDLPKDMTAATDSTRNEADRLARIAAGMAPKPWREFWKMCTAGAVAALVVIAGQATLSELVRRSVTPQPVASAQQIQSAANWEWVFARANPKEKELIREIARRPAK